MHRTRASCMLRGPTRPGPICVLGKGSSWKLAHRIGPKANSAQGASGWEAPKPDSPSDIGAAASPSAEELLGTSSKPPTKKFAEDVFRWLSKYKIWMLAGALGCALAAPAIASFLSGTGPATLNKVPMASVTLSDWVMERTVWLLGKVSGCNVVIKVILVLASTLPAVLAFGTLYSAIASVEMKHSFIKMYALLNRLPGAGVLNEATVPAAVLVNVAFIVGTFIFAVLLGIVSEEVTTLFKNIRNGKYQLNQAGHVVVLNWNEQAVPLLRQIAVARKNGQAGMFSRPVAVLAEMSKSDMDDAIFSKLKGLDLDVVTRNGSPSVPQDLASVAAAQAAAVIVLTPEACKVGQGATPSSTAVALSAAASATDGQNIVFQAPDQHVMAEEHVAAFKRLTGLGSRAQILTYSDADLVERMTAVSAVQPGILRVVAQLLGQATLRIQPMPPSLIGCTYQHARRMFADGVLCGLMKGDGVNMLIPEAHVLTAEERLVLVAPDAGAPQRIDLNARAEPIFLRASEGVNERLKAHAQVKRIPRNICIISPAPEKALDLTRVFSELAPKGSVVTFLTPTATTGPRSKGNCSFKYLSPARPGDSCISGSLLREAGIDRCSSVVVTGLDGMPHDEADGFVTSALLQVQDSARLSSRTDAPHFVAQIRKPSTQTAIMSFLDVLKKEARVSGGAGAGQVIIRPDLFLSDDLCGGILAHTASNPSFAHLVQDLLDNEGAEVYVRHPASFNLYEGDLLTFADVAETTRAFNETAIGIMRGDGAFTLAPEPTYPLNLQAGDRVIVLAQDYTSKRA